MQKLELRNRKEQKIVGVLRMPEGEVRGTAVIQHGYSGAKNEAHVEIMEQAFYDNGFITFNFDTTNSFGESEGDFWEARLGLHAEDLEDVTRWVQKQEWFRVPLALTGHSMGGHAIVRYAELHPDEVNILVPVAPVVSGTLSWEAHQEHSLEDFEQFRKQGYRELVSSRTGVVKKIPWAEMEERLNHDLLPDAGKISMPTLLIVGSEDDTCRPKDIQLLFKSLVQNPKNEYQEILGAPHTYRTEEHLEGLYNIINNWLKNL